jgi:hypothetical protein
VHLVALDDFHDPAAGIGGSSCYPWPLISGVGEDPLDERKQGSRALVEDQRGPVAILDIGGMDGNAQQQSERVDEDVTLAAGDLLARIVTLRINRGPPFCAALALWLSMIAAVGLVARPSCSRIAT